MSPTGLHVSAGTPRFGDPTVDGNHSLGAQSGDTGGDEPVDQSCAAEPPHVLLGYLEPAEVGQVGVAVRSKARAHHRARTMWP